MTDSTNIDTNGIGRCPWCGGGARDRPSPTREPAAVLHAAMPA